MEHLQYPIGSFQPIQQLDVNQRTTCIDRLEEFPDELRTFTESFTNADWKRPYRDNGWTAAQLINHLADSHLHSYARFKHALTENKPTIKDYPESLWAQLEDAQSIASVKGSLLMITGIHLRWVAFLRNCKAPDFDRTFYHPKTQSHHSLHKALAYYSWHCDHHLGHLKIIKNQV